MRALRFWYRNNKLFLLFVLWSIAAYVVPSSLLYDPKLVLNVSASFLQLSGLAITFTGLLSVRKEFAAKSLSELASQLFTFKLPRFNSGSGRLLTIKSTVLDVNPVVPEECCDRDDRIDRNIAALFECINSDRVSIRYLMDSHKITNDKIQTEIIPKVGTHLRRSEKVHLHGSGLALTGLVWVGIGMIEAAIATFIIV